MRPFAPGAEPVPGTVVLGHLARSNVCDVYDAWCEDRACRVALKVLRPDKRASATWARALVREGALLRRLSHPHVVRGYAVHEEPLAAVVLETLPGATLEAMLQDGEPLGDDEARELGAQLAGALRHLHRNGVLHLDLKTSNVIGHAGSAKLLDLSHARPPGVVGPGHGTWHNAAPEQVRGGAVGPASDVWGLGLLLHECLADEHPLFAVAEDLDVDDAQCHVRLPPPPGALGDLVHRCTDPDPAARPPLDEVLSELGATPPARRSRPSRPARPPAAPRRRVSGARG